MPIICPKRLTSRWPVTTCTALTTCGTVVRNDDACRRQQLLVHNAVVVQVQEQSIVVGAAHGEEETRHAARLHGNAGVGQVAQLASLGHDQAQVKRAGVSADQFHAMVAVLRHGDQGHLRRQRDGLREGKKRAKGMSCAMALSGAD